MTIIDNCSSVDGRALSVLNLFLPVDTASTRSTHNKSLSCCTMLLVPENTERSFITGHETTDYRDPPLALLERSTSSNTTSLKGQGLWDNFNHKIIIYNSTTHTM